MEQTSVIDVWTLAVTLAGGLAGAVAGSAVHAVAVRLPADLAPVGVPVCAHCASPASAIALMPGRSGACAACGQSAGWHKSATELAGAALTMLALLVHGLSLTGVSVALFCLVLLLILRIDWQHHLIFTATIVPGIGLALGLAALNSFDALLSAGLASAGAAFAFILFFVLAIVIYRQQALGFGDILLAALIGAMTGTAQVVSAIFLGMVLAALGGLFLVAIRQRTRRDYIPYGAYLCAGTIITLLLR